MYDVGLRDCFQFVYICICSGTVWEYTTFEAYIQEISGHVIDLNVSFKETKNLVCSFCSDVDI